MRIRLPAFAVRLADAGTAVGAGRAGIVSLAVPTVSTWGQIVMVLLVMAAGGVVSRRACGRLTFRIDTRGGILQLQDKVTRIADEHCLERRHALCSGLSASVEESSAIFMSNRA